MSSRSRGGTHWRADRAWDILIAMVSTPVRPADPARGAELVPAPGSDATPRPAPASAETTRSPFSVVAAWRSIRSAYTDIFVDDWGPRRWVRARIFGLLFLGFLTTPVKSVLHSDWSAPRQAIALAGLAAFAVCFAIVVWRNTPALHHNRTPGTLAVGVGAGVVALAAGVDWLTAFSIYTIAMLLYNCARRWWLPIVIAVPVGNAVLGVVVVDLGVRHAIEAAVPVMLIGAVQAAFYQQIRSKIELAQARTDLARLAVSEERLRIARDLHDILGQRLSALSLKAELAARLVERDPHRAAGEMGEVAAVARAALADVRDTVSGYRTLTLATEIETARALLTAAGMEVKVSCGAGSLPAAIDECAGALVREAVTNLIRHSVAQRCSVVAGRRSGGVVVEVRNRAGGTGTSSAAVVYGNGLTGLAERVDGVGGVLWVGHDDGEFVVRATLPFGASA